MASEPTARRVSKTELLRVNLVGVEDEGFHETLPVRWRISALVGEEWYVMTPKTLPEDFYFARRIDAELALAGLLAAGIDTAEKATKAGWKKCRAIMCESLAW